MIHSRAGTRTMKNGALQKFVIAVLIGFLPGGAYAVAEQPPESQAQMPLPKQRAAQQSHITKSLRAGDDCGARVDRLHAGVVVALPMPKSGGASDRYAAVNSPRVSEAGRPILHVFDGFLPGMLSLYIATRVYPSKRKDLGA